METADPAGGPEAKPAAPTVRRAEEREWDALDAVLSEAYGRRQPEEVRAAQRELFEFDRALVAEYAGETTVAGGVCGCASSYSLRMRVPGNTLPTAGVTWCGVLPTHRRRGVLSELMRRQLTDIQEGTGEPLAALITTEPAIYGRFGYGVASRELSLTVPRSADALLDAPVDPRVRLVGVDPAEALPRVESVYAAACRDRPGTLVRDAAWARHTAADPPALRRGASPLRCVLAVRDGEAVGYVRYATTPAVDAGVFGGTVRVRDVLATTPAAYAALWRYVLDLDLTDTVVARVPVDDPLPLLLADARRARPVLSDQLHLRLVDVGAALSQRTYATEVDVVLEVRDAFCPWNAGRWRLSAEPGGGAVCERTGAAAHIALDVRELGAVYLGGGSLRALEAAGRVTGERAAVSRLSRACAGETAPYCGNRF